MCYVSNNQKIPCFASLFFDEFLKIRGVLQKVTISGKKNEQKCVVSLQLKGKIRKFRRLAQTEGPVEGMVIGEGPVKDR